MADGPNAQIDSYLPHLEALIRRGRELGSKLTSHPEDVSAASSMRMWQESCGVTVNQLSGGSKSHWLARAYSRAFLIGGAGAASSAEIVIRLVEVLEKARASLDRMRAGETAEAPAPRRFDFVHNSELRPVLEQAYAEARSALEQARFNDALLTSCGILESIVTDALESSGQAPAGWTFEQRLEAAEKAGLIRSGWVRLPAIARAYRESQSILSAPESEARKTLQVLNVVMRDLNPGR